MTRKPVTAVDVGSSAMDKTAIFKFIVGYLLFSVVVTSVTLSLQYSLILYRLVGWPLHWAVILLATPLLVGLAYKIIRVPHPGLAALMGGITAAAIAYPNYRTLFRQPPHPLAAVAFALITAGVAFAGSLRIKRKVRVIKEERQARRQREAEDENVAVTYTYREIKEVLDILVAFVSLVGGILGILSFGGR